MIHSSQFTAPKYPMEFMTWCAQQQFMNCPRQTTTGTWNILLIFHPLFIYLHIHPTCFAWRPSLLIPMNVWTTFAANKEEKKFGVSSLSIYSDVESGTKFYFSLLFIFGTLSSADIIRVWLDLWGGATATIYIARDSPFPRHDFMGRTCRAILMHSGKKTVWEIGRFEDVDGKVFPHPPYRSNNPTPS